MLTINIFERHLCPYVKIRLKISGLKATFSYSVKKYYCCRLEKYCGDMFTCKFLVFSFWSFLPSFRKKRLPTFRVNLLFLVERRVFSDLLYFLHVPPRPLSLAIILYTLFWTPMLMLFRFTLLLLYNFHILSCKCLLKGDKIRN